MANMAQNAKRRVLVCVDGSKQAENAFKHYLQDQKREGDYVFGLIIPQYKISGVSAIKMVGPLADTEALEKEFKGQHAQVEKIISDYTADLRKAGVTGSFEQFSTSDPPQVAIIERCQVYNCDYIIMGSRGLTGIKKFFLGSCSNFVLNHASVPVTVVPYKHHDEEEEEEQQQKQ